MRYGNPWSFGLIFIIVAGYLMWNSFELPAIFIGETQYTTGKVVSRVVTGRARQIITYAYRANDSIYTQKKRLAPDIKPRLVGSTMKIKYEVNQPSKHEIEAHYKSDFYSNLRTNFFGGNKEFTEEFFLQTIL